MSSEPDFSCRVYPTPDRTLILVLDFDDHDYIIFDAADGSAVAFGQARTGVQLVNRARAKLRQLGATNV